GDVCRSVGAGGDGCGRRVDADGEIERYRRGGGMAREGGSQGQPHRYGQHQDDEDHVLGEGPTPRRASFQGVAHVVRLKQVRDACPNTRGNSLWCIAHAGLLTSRLYKSRTFTTERTQTHPGSMKALLSQSYYQFRDHE